MKRVGELYEVVVFTASVSKVCLLCVSYDGQGFVLTQALVRRSIVGSIGYP